MQLVSRLNHLGGTLDPHACFLLQRGLKTLPLRVRQQSTNALALAHFLENQPQVLLPATYSASCTKDSKGWQVASMHTRRHDASGDDDCIQVRLSGRGCSGASCLVERVRHVYAGVLNPSLALH